MISVTKLKIVVTKPIQANIMRALFFPLTLINGKPSHHVYDWLVALVGYILGDQIFTIGVSLFHASLIWFVWFFFLFFQKTVTQHSHRTQSCGEMNCNNDRIGKRAIIQ